MVDLKSDPSFIWQESCIIAGPCSVESKAQIFSIAESLSKNKKVKFLRGGVWKARTRPGGFEGYGLKALDWLVEAGKTFYLPVTTEVATTKHIEEALKRGVHALWIGSRSVGSPFVMEELAEALRGTHMELFVKNPTSPDIELWTGAIERFFRKNISKVAAIHRGFSTNWQSRYRNEPKWELPIELKMRIPEIKILVDPSHISGNSDLLFDVCNHAMKLCFDGLMIEVHNSPRKALTDFKQQITPLELENILSKLKMDQKRKNSYKSLEHLKMLELLEDIKHTKNNMAQMRLETLKRMRLLSSQNSI